MPYCPKCDMEFVEGITVCSDCKGPLVASKEEAMAMKRQAQEEEEARKQAEFEAMQKAYEEEMAEEMTGFSESGCEEASSEEEIGRPAAPYGAVQNISAVSGRVKPSMPHAQVYVKKSQKYSDLRSSADAFLLVGGALTAVSVLLWTGFISFPGSNFSSPIVKLVLTIMGLGSLYISWRSFKSAKQVQSQVAEEEQATQNLIQWFLDSHTAEEMDARLKSESGDLAPEELSLKRFELIQDILITSHDLADQSYVDMLAEEIYGKVFES